MGMQTVPLAPDVPPANTPEWEEWRRGGLGASDLPALIGEDPWTTERGLALEKRGLVPHRAQNDAMRWGHRVEELGALDYQERTGRRLLPGGTAMDPRWPRLFASPDRRIEGENGLVELKWSQRWKEPPKRVRIQTQAQMGLSGADFVDLVVMGPFGEPAIQRIDRDDSEIVPLLDWGQEWYERYVLGDELPDVDGSEATRHHLEQLLGEVEMDATDDQVGLMERIRQARFDAAAAEKEEALARNLLLVTMAGRAVVNGPGWKVTYRATKGRTTVGWEEVARVYADLLTEAYERRSVADALGRLGLPGVPFGDALEEVQKLYTLTGEPGHRFTPSWS